MSDETYVIVGASLAGAKAAETLRADGFAGRVVLIGEETEPPYERPPLSKGYLLGAEPREKAFLHEPQWYAENDIDWRPGTLATAIDLEQRTVTLHPTGHASRYDKLLLATGSTVRRLTAPGADLPGVHYLRTLDQADALLAGFRRAGHVVVIGAGWIGLETAAAARQHGCAVTVVEMDSLPLRRVLGDEVATIYRDLHAAARGRPPVRGRRPGDQGHRRVGRHRRLFSTTAGRWRPTWWWSGSASGRTWNWRNPPGSRSTTGWSPTPCCGPRTRTSSPAGTWRRRSTRCWAPGFGSSTGRTRCNGGPAAARSMLGSTQEYAPVPYFFSDQYDLGMEYTGWVTPGGYDQVVFRGDPTFSRGLGSGVHRVLGAGAARCWPG